jgi:hypothetical protein
MALVDDVGEAVFFSAGGGAATGALDPIAALIDPAWSGCGGSDASSSASLKVGRARSVEPENAAIKDG